MWQGLCNHVNALTAYYNRKIIPVLMLRGLFGWCWRGRDLLIPNCCALLWPCKQSRLITACFSVQNDNFHRTAHTSPCLFPNWPNFNVALHELRATRYNRTRVRLMRFTINCIYVTTDVHMNCPLSWINAFSSWGWSRCHFDTRIPHVFHRFSVRWWLFEAQSDRRGFP